MALFFRIILTFFVFIFVNFFVYWVPFSLIRDKLGLPTDSLIPTLVSLLLAALVAFFTWKKTGNLQNGLASHIILGGFLLGGISFILGFFGPMIFTPDANQGPLLGLFITGPLGFLAGLIGGGIYWKIKTSKGNSLK